MAKNEAELHVSEMKRNSTRRLYIERLEMLRVLTGGQSLNGRWPGTLESLYDTYERERETVQCTSVEIDRRNRVLQAARVLQEMATHVQSRESLVKLHGKTMTGDEAAYELNAHAHDLLDLYGIAS